MFKRCDKTWKIIKFAYISFSCDCVRMETYDYNLIRNVYETMFCPYNDYIPSIIAVHATAGACTIL